MLLKIKPMLEDNLVACFKNIETNRINIKTFGYRVIEKDFIEYINRYFTDNAKQQKTGIIKNIRIYDTTTKDGYTEIYFSISDIHFVLVGKLGGLKEELYANNDIGFYKLYEDIFKDKVDI